VLTGLASGMDTETMIQNSVTGYQTKISELQQQQTKIEWKQDAYRELTDQMNSIVQKYTSYSSKTNLASNSFFTGAATTSANGVNASAVTATGSTKSDIQINAVQKLATAARYSIDVGALDMQATSEAVGTAIDWEQSITKGLLSGTMTLKLGNSSIDLKFTEDDQYGTAQELVDAINSKLSAQNADAQATLSDGTVTFATKGAAQQKGDSVYILSASGNLKNMLNLTTARSTADENRFSYTTFSLKGDASELTKTMSMAEYLEGKTMDVTLDGVTKQIKLGAGLTDTETLKNDLQASIEKAFGKGKVTVSTTQEGGVRFDVNEKSGSTIKVSSGAIGSTLGLGEAGVSNYFNTSRKLGSLLSEETLKGMRIAAESTGEERYFDKDGNELKKSGDAFYRIDKDGAFILKDGEKVEGNKANTFGVDAQGRLVSQYANEEGEHYLVNEKGDYYYELKINGATVDGLTKDTALESVINKINSNVDMGVNVSFSSLTSQFVFTARETGAGGEISFDNDLAKRLFSVDNDPSHKKVGELLGDFLNWDENGNATFAISDPANYYSLGTINKDETTVGQLIDLINGASPKYKDMIAYNEETGAYQLSDAGGNAMSDEAGNRISFVNDDTYANIGMADLFARLNAATRTKGEDAVVEVTVNGTKRTLERSSNVIAMDGLNVTLKETFTAEKASDAITFTTSSDADKIAETVKSFVEDVNKLMKDVHDAYSTQPLKKSSGSTKRDGYEPLTEDDKKDMSESAIKAYEEKAKKGLLFGDNDLSQLYGRLLDAVQSFGSDRVDMKAIGIDTTYSNGVTQLKLDENALREALSSDPDKVRNVFAKTKDGGSATNGLMETLKTTLNAYGSTSLGSPGILVRKAGSRLSAVSLMNNTLQKQIDNLNNQIERWQSRLSDKVDYYTKQFTQLEKLMGTMNNQSSMLADLMGG
jgi:flagellar capping protein FliD